jgi:GR25 family glycosyltransferase involved in LPS biosynthesis
MDQIDTFYFINLERRKDRLQQIKGELTKMNIPIDKIIHINAFDHKIGALGCSKSHIYAVQHFINSGKNRCMILEDDFEFTETQEKVNEILENVFSCSARIDCLVISGCGGFIVKTTNPYLEKVIGSSTTAGYIITKEYAPKLLYNFIEGAEKQEKWINTFNVPENAFNLDFYWMYEQINRNFYNTIPKLGKQRDSPSDITGTSFITLTALPD